MTVRIREALELAKLSGDVPDLTRLWITDRSLRVAEYQDTVDQINEQIDEIRYVPQNPYDPESQSYAWEKWDEWFRTEWKPGRIPAMLIREKLNALRSAAEELGQLPAAPDAGEADPTFTVAGISDDELKAGLT